MTIAITNAILKALQARAEAAQERYETQERMLYREDGQPVYGEAEMRERLGALRAERTAALRGIQEEARGVGEAASAEVANIENADPLAHLSAEELAKANARRPFALDAAEALGEEALVARLRSVLANGDRGEIGAYLAAGSRARGRADGSPAEAWANGQRRSQGNANAGLDGVLDGVLGEMRAALVGDGEAGRVEAAKTREREAVSVEMLAGNLEEGARSAAAAWASRVDRGVA